MAMIWADDLFHLPPLSYDTGCDVGKGMKMDLGGVLTEINWFRGPSTRDFLKKTERYCLYDGI